MGELTLIVEFDEKVVVTKVTGFVSPATDVLVFCHMAEHRELLLQD